MLGGYIAVPGDYISVRGGYIMVPGGYILVLEGYILVPRDYIPVQGGYIALQGRLCSGAGQSLNFGSNSDHFKNKIMKDSTHADGGPLSQVQTLSSAPNRHEWKFSGALVWRGQFFF